MTPRCRSSSTWPPVEDVDPWQPYRRKNTQPKKSIHAVKPASCDRTSGLDRRKLHEAFNLRAAVVSQEVSRGRIVFNASQLRVPCHLFGLGFQLSVLLETTVRLYSAQDLDAFAFPAALNSVRGDEACKHHHYNEPHVILVSHCSIICILAEVDCSISNNAATGSVSFVVSRLP